MFPVLLAVLVAGSCVAASLRRLKLAAAPSELDLATLAEAGRAASPTVLRAVLAAQPEGTFERDLAEALDAEGRMRIAAMNECLTELDYQVGRWARVPRVAASIASTSAFLLAATALRSALGDASALEDEARGVALDAAIFRAVDIVAVGLAAAAVCIAVQMRAHRLARRASEGADALVERLEAQSQGTGRGAASYE